MTCKPMVFMRSIPAVLCFLAVSGLALAGQAPVRVDPNLMQVIESQGNVEVIVSFREPAPSRERGRRTQVLGDIRRQQFNDAWFGFEEHMGKGMNDIEVIDASPVALTFTAIVHSRNALDRIRQFARVESIRQVRPTVRIREEQEAESNDREPRSVL